LNLQHLPVDYNDALHKYSLNGTGYTSASQLVEKFTNKFDAAAVAENYARKNGQTAAYWIEQWAKKNSASLERGNRIHDANEMALHGRMIDTVNGQQMPVIGEVIQETIPWIERPDGVYTERKLWHHGYKIAGRADKIILLTETGGNMLAKEFANNYRYRIANIEDYKTNEKLNFESYQYRDGNRKMMLRPLTYIQDCNWFHYCLQLSTYMFMLEYQGFIPGTMHIIHYPHPTAEEPNPQKQRHEVPYMKKEVIAMCNFINKIL